MKEGDQGVTPGGRCMGTSAPGVSEDGGEFSPTFRRNSAWDPQEPEGTEGSKDPCRCFTPKASSGLGGCGLLRCREVRPGQWPP